MTDESAIPYHRDAIKNMPKVEFEHPFRILMHQLDHVKIGDRGQGIA